MAKNKLTVIIQAGGRGSRLRHHTWNKPKCLVSIRGKPILYHALNNYKEASHKIIGDYRIEQIEAYMLMSPPEVDFELIKANGVGTVSGIKLAITNINEKSPILIIWSDLINSRLTNLNDKKPIIFTTSRFTCRWSVGENGKLLEEVNSTRGVPGIFYFPNKSFLKNLPEEGEFVKWLANSGIEFNYRNVDEIEELGDFVSIERNNDRAGFSRFFNKVHIKETFVTKTVIDKNYDNVHENEKNWYRSIKKLGFRRIPEVLGYAPLTLSRINGQHLHDINDLSERETSAVISDYLDSLLDLHDKLRVQTRREDIVDMYIKKTLTRIESVANVIPNMEKTHITINGKKCRNFYHEKHRDIFQKLIPSITPDYFCAIHGDPTFSNTLIDSKLRVWFIDPRGSFAKPGIEGDSWYDFAKFYYSAIGSYDQFNRRKFKLHVDNDTVEIIIEEPKHSNVAQEILKEYFPLELNRIKIIHSLIWLSLSGYVKDDVDSIIGAFYYGNYWLERALDE